MKFFLASAHICFFSAEDPIHLALLIPISGAWPAGLADAGAAALAIERVNAHNELLPGRVLEYSWADSGCSAKQGLKAMGELFAKTNHVDVVIGPGCSTACEVTSYLTGGREIPQISCAHHKFIICRLYRMRSVVIRCAALFLHACAAFRGMCVSQSVLQDGTPSLLAYNSTFHGSSISTHQSHDTFQLESAGHTHLH